MSVPTRPGVMTPVALSVLAELAGVDPPVDDVEVTGICLRSSEVRPGDLYAGLPGTRTHGARFIPQARAAGAAAVLTDAAGLPDARAAGLPTLVVDPVRSVLGTVAATVYGSPATAFTLVGVTGTQGKTTVTQLLGSELAAAGARPAVIGTMGTWVDGEPVKTPLTTPEAPDLQAMFAVMRERGVEVCAMEVSSHALALGRVDGVVFDLAVFLNFGRDHLDFHGDLDSYFAAKASLFAPARARRALLNADDPRVAGLRDRLEIPTRMFSASGRPADWRCAEVSLGADGSDFSLHGPDGLQTPVSTRLAGDYNVTNALASLAAVGETGYDVRVAAVGLSRVVTVRGRLERVEEGQPFAVVIDYAHKPDAVEAALRALRMVTSGRLWVVLGAGGDRDHGKRPLMGQAAARLSDVVVVTDDNPRSEDPATIRAALLAGARSTLADRPGEPGEPREPAGGAGRQTRTEIHEVEGRRQAIERALSGAQPGDTVLIAGKGHETGQEIGDRVLAFDDRAVAVEILRRLPEPGHAP